MFRMNNPAPARFIVDYSLTFQQVAAAVSAVVVGGEELVAGCCRALLMWSDAGWGSV